MNGTMRVLQRLILLTIASAGMHAQRGPLTLAQAVDAAVQNYPSIRVSQEQMNAAAAGIRLAQTAYLPRVDGLAQLNRATRNTTYGLLLPQGVLPGVDGVPANNFGTVWDSGMGVLVSWQPFDFGLRRANISSAAAARARAEATVNRTRYDVSAATADAYLTVLAAQQTALAARASVESWQILLRSVHALVTSELRPGADESRVEAELALAQAQVARAEQAIDVARANVAEFVGLPPAEVEVDPGKMLDQLPAELSLGAAAAALNVNANPIAQEQSAAVSEERARLDALGRVNYPQFSVQGLASARGTGMENNGERLGALNGMAPTVENYAVGLTVTFPFMERYAIREQEAAQTANLRAAQAQSQVIATQLEARYNAAAATLAGARRVAGITPVEVSSARAALDQATARYQAGLAPIDDVAQSQRLLVQAQIDNALARLSVWRARLELDSARGDIQPFITEAGR
jgi:outer membrane protein